MRRIVRRPRARQDLLETWEYIATESNLDRTDNYLRRLENALRNLATHPQTGRVRPELADGMRGFPFEDHVVFYLPFTDGIDVVRVIHGSRDLEAAWTER